MRRVMSAATLEKEESELLDAHKAALRRVASKPQLVTQMSGGPNGRTDYRPKTLSLVCQQPACVLTREQAVTWSMAASGEAAAGGRGEEEGGD